MGSNPTRSASFAFIMRLEPTSAERLRRDSIIDALLRAIESASPIRMPKASEESPFHGSVGPFSYFFEGEDDLLHLGVLRDDGIEVMPAEAQEVAAFLLAPTPPGLIWIKPGVTTQHFYVGHDVLLEHLEDKK